MSGRGRVAFLALGGALSLAACDVPTVPARTDVYDYHQDGMIFRWTTCSTVRLFVAGDGEAAMRLRAWTEQAARQWTAGSLFHDYTLVVTDRLERADVVVRSSSTPLPVSTPPPEQASCSQGGGHAHVVFCIDLLEPRLRIMPIIDAEPDAQGRVRAIVTVVATALADTATARRLVLHEVGHVVGVWNHSDDPADVMYGGLLAADELTKADRSTVHALYRTPPNITY
jgi:hypothetical protein